MAGEARNCKLENQDQGLIIADKLTRIKPCRKQQGQKEEPMLTKLPKTLGRADRHRSVRGGWAVCGRDFDDEFDPDEDPDWDDVEPEPDEFDDWDDLELEPEDDEEIPDEEFADDDSWDDEFESSRRLTFRRRRTECEPNRGFFSHHCDR